MDFSWFGITVIDIGIVSVGIIGFTWLFRRIAILERENGRLQAENGRLQAEVDALTKEVDRLTGENRDLQQELNILAARYTEIKEMLTLLLKRENFIQ
ncbi:hypothetical protein F4Y93_04380 [Candidatus Poribacteria bacterium]|nr:hypothetical protein [Candidatus Poribacteria bacterium]